MTGEYLDSIKYYYLKVNADLHASTQWAKPSGMEANPEKFGLLKAESGNRYWPADSAFKSNQECRAYVNVMQKEFNAKFGLYENRVTWFGMVSHMAAMIGCGYSQTPEDAYNFVKNNLSKWPAEQATAFTKKICKDYKDLYWRKLQKVDHLTTHPKTLVLPNGTRARKTIPLQMETA